MPQQLNKNAFFIISVWKSNGHLLLKAFPVTKNGKVEELNKIDKLQIYERFHLCLRRFVCTVAIENEVLFTKPATV